MIISYCSFRRNHRRPCSLPRLSAVFVAVAATALSGCTTTTTNLGLIGDQQTLPMPSFYASDEDTPGRLPRFAQIRVYELTDGCSVPNCPIAWDVVVSAKHAPNEFVYGGFPGFGAQTVIPAQPLKPGGRYLLETLPDQFGTPDGKGEFYFSVTDEGLVVADRK